MRLILLLILVVSCYSFLYSNDELILHGLNTTSCSGAPACGNYFNQFNNLIK